MKIVMEHEVKGDEVKPPYARVIKHLATPWTMGTKNISLGVVKIEVGGMTPLHSHDVNEEVFFIISGRGKIIVEGEEIKVEPGNCIYAPPQMAHQIINTSDETLKLVWAFSPPLDLKTFRALAKLE